MVTRNRLPDVIFAASCVIAMGLMLWMASGLTFFQDEWFAIMSADDWSFDELMRPHNEHWSLGLKAIYKVLMATVGLHSYLPYVVVLVAFHIATATAIYVYARQQTDGLVALAVGTLFLFLGSGYDNILWAFQIGFTGAAAAGTWALVILLREPLPSRAWLAAVLLVIAVVTAGVGLFFLAAATSVLLVSSERRSRIWVVLPALSTYGAWYLAYGVGADGPLPDLLAFQTFVQGGIGNAVGRITSLGPDIGLVLAVLLALAGAADLALGRSPRLGLLAGLTGLACQWLVIGVARAGWLQGSWVAPRYVHIAAIFILIAFVGLLGHRALAPSGRRAGLVLAVVGVLAVALAGNLAMLRAGRDDLAARADSTRAFFSVLLAYGGTAAIPDDHGILMTGDGLRLQPDHPAPLIAGSAGLRDLFDRYGSVLEDPLAMSPIVIPDDARDREFAIIVLDAIRLSQAAMPADPEPFTIEGSDGLEVSEEGPCWIVRPLGTEPNLRMAVPSGADLYVESEDFGVAEVLPSLSGTYPGAGLAFETEPGVVTRIELPDIGPTPTLRVRLRPPGEGITRLCMATHQVESPGFTISDLVIRPTIAPAGSLGPPDVHFANDVTLELGPGGCLDATATGPDPYVSMQVPDHEGLLIAAARDGTAQVFLLTKEGYSEDQSVYVTLTPEPVEVFMPPGSKPEGWAIRVDPPGDQVTILCLVPVEAS